MNAKAGRQHLCTEHILLGIWANKDGTAVRILASIGVSPETLENRLYSYASEQPARLCLTDQGERSCNSQPVTDYAP
jgi:ATP-dependent Clp protease ATP-binding subunit ClpA